MPDIVEKEREFDYAERDFKRIRELIYGHAGIALSEKKRDMVYSRIARRVRALGLQRFSDYLDLVEQHESNEWEQFVNSLTTNLTSFFREPHHFPVLAELARKRPSGITVWCAAASTGEEPYSIAMTLAEVPSSLSAPARILATDLDTQVLSRAEAGIYPLDRVGKLPALQLRQYFQRGTGRNDGLARVRPGLREMIEFAQINLLDPQWPVTGPLDAIFCRNVMIYFDKQTQRRILERFVPLLAPHGLLFAGHSENFHNAQDLFRPCGKTIYAPIQRTGRKVS